MTTSSPQSPSSSQPPAPASTEREGILDEREQAARLYIEQLRVFYVHATFFAIGMFVMVTVNLMTNLSAGIAGDWSAWWSRWALLGWGAGIAVHGLVVRLNRPTPGTSSWEQKHLNKLLGTRDHDAEAC